MAQTNNKCALKTSKIKEIFNINLLENINNKLFFKKQFFPFLRILLSAVEIQMKILSNFIKENIANHQTFYNLEITSNNVDNPFGTVHTLWLVKRCFNVICNLQFIDFQRGLCKCQKVYFSTILDKQNQAGIFLNNSWFQFNVCRGNAIQIKYAAFNFEQQQS